MTITAYKCNDDPKTVSKTLSAAQQFADVRPIEPVDIMNPNFLMNYRAELLSYNYMYAFGRYYFMRATVEPAGAMRLICSEDVLYTHAAGILAAPCICARNTSQYNSGFPDGKYRTYQRKIIETKWLFDIPNDDNIIFGFVE